MDNLAPHQVPRYDGSVVSRVEADGTLVWLGDWPTLEIGLRFARQISRENQDTDYLVEETGDGKLKSWLFRNGDCIGKAEAA